MYHALSAESYIINIGGRACRADWNELDGLTVRGVTRAEARAIAAVSAVLPADSVAGVDAAHERASAAETPAAREGVRMQRSGPSAWEVPEPTESSPRAEPSEVPSAPPPAHTEEHSAPAAPWRPPTPDLTPAGAEVEPVESFGEGVLAMVRTEDNREAELDAAADAIVDAATPSAVIDLKEEAEARARMRSHVADREPAQTSELPEPEASPTGEETIAPPTEPEPGDEQLAAAPAEPEPEPEPEFPGQSAASNEVDTWPAFCPGHGDPGAVEAVAAHQEMDGYCKLTLANGDRVKVERRGDAWVETTRILGSNNEVVQPIAGDAKQPPAPCPPDDLMEQSKATAVLRWLIDVQRVGVVEVDGGEAISVSALTRVAEAVRDQHGPKALTKCKNMRRRVTSALTAMGLRAVE